MIHPLLKIPLLTHQAVLTSPEVVHLIKIKAVGHTTIQQPVTIGKPSLIRNQNDNSTCQRVGNLAVELEILIYAPSELTLTEILKKWSHRPSGYIKKLDHLGHLLVTVPNIFPPKNTKVEPHEYFAKWKRFDKEAFHDVSRDEQKRGMPCQFYMSLHFAFSCPLC